MVQVRQGLLISTIILSIIIIIYVCWAYFSYRWSIENVCRAAALKYNRLNKKQLDGLNAIADQTKSTIEGTEAKIMFNIIKPEGLSSVLVRTEGPVKYLLQTEGCSFWNESCLEI